jgi:uncharacterized coiled-coil DUF342 family protein
MESKIEFFEGENEEELDIEKENEKLYQKLLKELEVPNKEEKPQKNNSDMVKAFKAFSKLEQNKFQSKDTQIKPQSNKSLYLRINDLQNELNIVSKEIKDYVEIYNDNSLLKEESNFNDILKELELYSSKLQNIISSDIYKNSINRKDIITKDNSQLKNEIKNNLESYTNSTARLLGLISQEKEDFMIQSNINTTTHEMYINKNYLDKNNEINNFENEILQIEKELNKIENIVGKKKLNKNEEIDLIKMIKQLIKTINDKKFQIYKEKALTELNEVLDELLKEKEISNDISEYSLKIKELYAIYEIYENYDEIIKYIKQRLMAICDLHEKSTDFNSDLNFLKKLIEENEKQFAILGKRYNETFEELANMEIILKELKNMDKYFSSLLVE